MNDYPHNLSIQILSPLKNYQVVELSGDMDKAGLAQIKEKIDNLTENFAPSYLVLDFTNLRFINSESIGFIMAIHSHLVKTGKKLVIVSAQPNIKDIFDVIGLFHIVEYYESLALFIEKEGK